MAQYQAWEKEYKNPKLVSNSNEPQLDFKHFVKWLRKDQKLQLEGLHVLDLGSGTGKNSIFLAERGCKVIGIEISDTAITLANQRAKKEAGVDIKFIKSSIGESWPIEDTSVDCAIDVVSSNSLDEEERNIYSKELKRVIKPGGYVFVKALCKDGDKNALNLLHKFPGKEKDTYILPEVGITERVFNRADIETFYKDFSILRVERKTSYTMLSGKPFKRNFWLLYLGALPIDIKNA
ncbi:MAG: methyltransferase domain-containing protein [bacterium]|nr:methyltransferase domain-containing protein [bacterium]